MICSFGVNFTCKFNLFKLQIFLNYVFLQLPSSFEINNLRRYYIFFVQIDIFSCFSKIFLERLLIFSSYMQYLVMSLAPQTMNQKRNITRFCTNYEHFCTNKLVFVQVVVKSYFHN